MVLIEQEKLPPNYNHIGGRTPLLKIAWHASNPNSNHLTQKSGMYEPNELIKTVHSCWEADWYHGGHCYQLRSTALSHVSVCYTVWIFFIFTCELVELQRTVGNNLRPPGCHSSNAVWCFHASEWPVISQLHSRSVCLVEVVMAKNGGQITQGHYLQRHIRWLSLQLFFVGHCRLLLKLSVREE